MAESYFYNCRGANFVPTLQKEWDKSGGTSRYPQFWLDAIAVGPSFAFLRVDGHDFSNAFVGSNKTSQWYYYDGDEVEEQLQHMRDIGFNAVRVFLDPYMTFVGNSHFEDVRDFLFRADKTKIRVQFTFLDSITTHLVPIAALDPGNLNQINDNSASALHYRLLAWTRTPFDNHRVSAVDTDIYGGGHVITNGHLDFWSRYMLPYLSGIIEYTHDMEALWAYDIGNELGAAFGGDIPPISYVSSNGVRLTLAASDAMAGIVVSSVDYARQRIDELNSHVKLTYSDASPYFDPNLTGPYGSGVGGFLTDTNLGVLSAISGSLDFLSCHPYCFSDAYRKRLSNLMASASELMDLPIQFNEATWIERFNNYGLDMSAFHIRGFGGLPWQASVDHPFSNTPFIEDYGMLHSDGELRYIQDASAYIELSKKWNWIKNHEYKIPVEKGYTTNKGEDGGYASSLPLLDYYNPAIATAQTKTQWENSRYLNASSFFIGVAQNFLPQKNFPLAREITSRPSTIITSGFITSSPGDIQNLLEDWALAGVPDLTGIVATDGSAAAISKMAYMDYIIDYCYLAELQSLFQYDRSQKKDTIWEWSAVGPTNRSDFADAYIHFENVTSGTSRGVDQVVYVPPLILSNLGGSVTAYDTVASNVSYPDCLKIRGSQAIADSIAAVFTTSAIGTCLYTEDGYALFNNPLVTAANNSTIMPYYLDFNAYTQKYQSLVTAIYNCTLEMEANGWPIGFPGGTPPISFPYFNNGY